MVPPSPIVQGIWLKYSFDAFSIAPNNQVLLSGAFQPSAASSNSNSTDAPYGISSFNIFSMALTAFLGSTVGGIPVSYTHLTLPTKLEV